MPSPLVSIIIPAYNAEKYLGECLESVRRQTFADFEAIVVDDGSTDGTAAIAEGYVERDSRFRLMHIANGGVSKARNAGIEESKGRWLTFMDADDIIHPRALESWIEAANDTHAKVCISGFKRFKDEPPETGMRKGKGALETLSYEETMKKALYQKCLLNSPWGILIDRKCLGVRRFRESIRYEDLDAFYRFYEGAGRICYIRQPLYFYRQHPGSFLHSWSDGRLDVLDVTDRIVEFFGEKYPALLPAAEDRRFSAHYNMLVLMKRNGVKNRQALERCRQVIKDGRKRALKDPNVRLKNKIGALLSYLFPL